MKSWGCSTHPSGHSFCGCISWFATDATPTILRVSITSDNDVMIIIILNSKWQDNGYLTDRGPGVTDPTSLVG